MLSRVQDVGAVQTYTTTSYGAGVKQNVACAIPMLEKHSPGDKTVATVKVEVEGQRMSPVRDFSLKRPARAAPSEKKETMPSRKRSEHLGKWHGCWARNQLGVHDSKPAPTPLKCGACIGRKPPDHQLLHCGEQLKDSDGLSGDALRALENERTELREAFVDLTGEEHKRYMQLVGALQCIAVVTRPEFALPHQSCLATCRI